MVIGDLGPYLGAEMIDEERKRLKVLSPSSASLEKEEGTGVVPKDKKTHNRYKVLLGRLLDIFLFGGEKDKKK